MKLSNYIFTALFDPGFGYYRTHNPIGKDSDFITAPEISQVFGELIAVYLLQIYSQHKGKVAIVEMGAGRGVMMRDILSSIKKLEAKNIELAQEFVRNTSVHIIEINEVLRKVQQENLEPYEVSWYESFPQFLNGMTDHRRMYFISNELFDCFPIDQFVLTERGWCEREVDGKVFKLSDFKRETHDFAEKEIGRIAPIGAVFEYSKIAREFMTQLCEALKFRGGILLNIDYGYLKREFANTLQALRNHQKVNVLENAGTCDITAHVDFLALDKIAKDFGLNSSLITQREFLISLGIEERRKALIEQNPQLADEINSSINRLIDQDQMGELFKCHIVWK